MIDQTYQAEITKNLDDQQKRPAQGPAPALPTFQNFFGGLGGAVAGPLQATAAFADLAKGYGEATASTGAYSAGGMFAVPSPTEEAQNNAARDKMMNEGLDMNSATGAALRTRAKDFMPDPQATGKAGQILGGLTNFAAQAVPAAIGGPPGLVALAAARGVQKSDELQDQGVDVGTRTVAGIASGTLDAASMLLPMTGATRIAAAAKGAVGGAATSIAQTEAEKLILQSGGYDKLASTYDPFDPVSIALSSLVPAAFGALHAPASASKAPGTARAEPTHSDVTLSPEEQAHSDAVEASTLDTDIASIQKEIAGQTDAGAKQVLQAELDRLQSQKSSSAPDVARKNSQAIENNTFSGQGRSAGSQYGFTQPPDTPIDRLFSNFADQPASSEAQSSFRDSMYDRANSDPKSFKNEKVESTTDDVGGGMSVQVDATPSGKTRVQVRQGGEVVAAAQLRNGMIDSIASKAKGTGAGQFLLQYINREGLGNIYEVPDRSPGFVKIQKALRRQLETATPDPDVDAAARVTQTASALDSSRLTPDDDILGVDQHQQAVETASDQIARGAPVEVGDIVGDSDANFARWFGDSKIVNDDGSPRVLYHGTAADVDSFVGKQAGSIFVADHPIVGEAYAAQSAKWMAENGQQGAPNISPVFARAEHPFDYENPVHVEAVADRAFKDIPTHLQGDGQRALILDGKDTLYTKSVLKHALQDGEWNLIESPEIQAAIKAEGHDAFYVHEDGFKNLGLHSPNQLKSAIGNSGRFDLNSGSLTDPLGDFGRAVEEYRASRNPEAEAPKPNHAAFNEAKAEAAAGEQAPKDSRETSAAKTPEGAEERPGPEASHLDAATAEILRANPDLMVQLDGMESPMRAADLLESVKESAAEEARDASLLEVAAQCAISL